MRRMRQVALYEAVTAEEVWALIRGLGARTLVFDVEPLVAVWATDTAALDSGVVETLRRVGELRGFEAEADTETGTDTEADTEADTETDTEIEAEIEAEAAVAGAVVAEAVAAQAGPGSAGGPEVVLFATNSARLPSSLPSLVGARVGYRASASKPLRIKGYRDLPRPGLVIGDQIATDGALAWRLGFDFVYYQPARDRIPLRPRVLHLIGRGVRPLLFRPFR